MVTVKDIKNLGYLKIRNKYLHSDVTETLLKSIDTFYSNTSTFNMSYFTLVSKWDLIEHLKDNRYFEGYYKLLQYKDFNFVKTGKADKRVKDRVSYTFKKVFTDWFFPLTNLDVTTRNKIIDASAKIPFVLALMSIETPEETKNQIREITTSEVESDSFEETFPLYILADLINDLFLWTEMSYSIDKDNGIEFLQVLVDLTPEDFSNYLRNNSSTS